MTYHNYIFFTVDNRIRDLPKEKRYNYTREFVKETKSAEGATMYSYATLGLKANTLFLLWLQADSPQVLQDYLNALLHTSLGKYLRITQTLFGMVRPTQY